MNRIRKITKHFRNPIWIGLGLLTVAIVVIFFATQILYNHTVTLLTDNLRSRLLTISITQAANIDAKDLEALNVESDWKKPEWAHVINKLHKAKYDNSDIVYMYIFRYIKNQDPNNNPQKMEFVADADSIDPYANTVNDPSGAAMPTSTCPKCVDVNRDGKIEPDGPDKLQWPGQPDNDTDAIPEAHQAYYGPITVKDIYTDEYGSVLTGYAPIKDDNGNTVAILGTDIKANDFFTITTQTLTPFIAFIVFLGLVISILTVVILLTWKKYTKSLEKFSYQISITNEQLESSKMRLEESNIKLKELDKLKTEFLSLAAHQLRSPLTAIKGYTSMLLEGDFGKIGEKQKEAVDRVFQSSVHLTNVVEELLNVSKIEAGGMKYTMAPFDIEKPASDLARDLGLAAEKKGLKLTFETDKKSPYIVMGDIEKIRQVILNLVDNSIKYTEKGGIEVILNKDEENHLIRVKIKDTGVGISPETKEKLFEKFSRGEGGKLNTTGSGLGLYLAKKITDDHGGHISIDSLGLGQGSTFTLELKEAK